MSKTRIIFYALGGILALGATTTLLGLALGWFNTGAQVISPANVKAQHAQVIGKYEALIAAAGNACQTQDGTVKDGKSPTLVEDPGLAYAATFRRIVADYNAAVDNLFKAGIVKPVGYPDSVDLKSLDTSDWCTVEAQLKNLK